MLTSEQNQEFQKLNKAVSDAIEARTNWMDAHMEAAANYKIGEEIYNLETGKLLGVVSSYYRYHRKQPFFDTSMHIDYQYQTSPGSNTFDNTSRQIGLNFGSLAQYRNVLKRQAEQKQKEAETINLRLQAQEQK